MRRCSATFSLLLLAFSLSGCTMWATYPPIEGAAGLNDPGMPPIPTLMAMAIEDHAGESGQGGVEGIEGPIVYNLPPGITESVYNRVERHLEPVAALPMIDSEQDAIHVTAVRIRTTEAEVDVVARKDGVAQMTTIKFKQMLFSPWKIVDRRHWRIRAAIPQPHYPGRVVPETGPIEVEPEPEPEAYVEEPIHFEPFKGQNP